MQLSINFISAFTCAAGALARSFKGMLKAKRSGVEVDWQMMAITTGEGFVIGIIGGAFMPNPVTALLAGYAGTNLLDGIGLQKVSPAK